MLRFRPRMSAWPSAPRSPSMHPTRRAAPRHPRRTPPRRRTRLEDARARARGAPDPSRAAEPPTGRSRGIRLPPHGDGVPPGEVVAHQLAARSASAGEKAVARPAWRATRTVAERLPLIRGRRRVRATPGQQLEQKVVVPPVGKVDGLSALDGRRLASQLSRVLAFLDHHTALQSSADVVAAAVTKSGKQLFRWHRSVRMRVCSGWVGRDLSESPSRSDPSRRSLGASGSIAIFAAPDPRAQSTERIDRRRAVAGPGLAARTPRAPAPPCEAARSPCAPSVRAERVRRSIRRATGPRPTPMTAATATCGALSARSRSHRSASGVIPDPTSVSRPARGDRCR